MSDIRPGASEALPWLEAVEDEDEAPAVSARKMLAALALVLIGVAIVAGTLFWLGRQDSGSGPPVPSVPIGGSRRRGRRRPPAGSAAGC